jgi:hypothetical protein
MAGFSAMAAAPTIKDIPDVVIGNEGGMTDANAYIYEDAINLTNYISDADNSVDDILISFEAVTARYKLNGNDSLAPTDDPVSPGAKAINTAVANGESNPDGNAKTVTFRDNTLTPLGGGAGETPADYSEVVTIWASDGDKASSRSIMVYTEVGGWDHLSGSAATGEVIHDIDFTNNADEFTVTDTIGSVSTSVTVDGICLTTALTGVNLVRWSSTYGFIPLAANSVWSIKMTVDSNVATQGSTPLWDIVLDNYNPTIGGPNAYGLDSYFLDNAGGADAASSTFGRTDFQVWYMPVAGATPQWNDGTNGALTAANDANNDLRVNFRIVDVDGAGYLAEQDAGTICMKNMLVERYDYDMLTAGDAVYTLDNITSSDVNATDVFSASSITYSGGNLTMAPSGSAWTDALVNVAPGDGVVDFGNAASLADDYPITWEADTLYEINVSVTASAAAVTNPPDVFRVGYDTPGNEIIGDSIVTPALGMAGMPKAAASDYKVIFYSHTPSKAGSLATNPIANFDRIRPKVGVICLTDLVLGGVDTHQGGITINSITVRKMSL